jgi:hypothetical protein
MSRDRALEVLSASSLTTGLPCETILSVLSRSTEKRCPDTAVVFREGEPAAAFLVVLEGRHKLAQKSGHSKEAP